MLLTAECPAPPPRRHYLAHLLSGYPTVISEASYSLPYTSCQFRSPLDSFGTLPPTDCRRGQPKLRITKLLTDADMFLAYTDNVSNPPGLVGGVAV